MQCRCAMRHTVRSLTPGGWSEVAKVLEVPQKRRVQKTDATVQKIARDCREILGSWVVSSISLAYSPSRAVGVDAPP